MSRRNGDFIITYTGRQFWPLDPCPNGIDILDIAHALSNVCRFTGHTRFHYSVAQHSVIASRQFNRYPENMQALLHDSAEAYICDMAKPVKRFINGYDEIEAKLMFTICEKFLLPWPFPAAIKDADNKMLWTEKRDLMRNHDEWRPSGEPYPFHIEQWTPSVAEREFLKRFEECKI